MPKVGKQSHKIKKDWFFIKSFSPWIQLFLKPKQALNFLVVQDNKLFYSLKLGWFGFLLCVFFSLNSDNLYSKNNSVLRSILPEIYHKVNRWVHGIHNDSVKDINAIEKWQLRH